MQGQNSQEPGQGHNTQPPGYPAATGNSLNLAQITYGGAAPEKPLSEFDKALKRLVNVDRIDEPAEQEHVLTLKQKKEEHKTKDGRSKGLPPVAIGLVGSNASLDHIKKVKPVCFFFYFVFSCLF